METWLAAGARILIGLYLEARRLIRSWISSGSSDSPDSDGTGDRREVNPPGHGSLDSEPTPDDEYVSTRSSTHAGTEGLIIFLRLSIHLSMFNISSQITTKIPQRMENYRNVSSNYLLLNQPQNRVRPGKSMTLNHSETHFENLWAHRRAKSSS